MKKWPWLIIICLAGYVLQAPLTHAAEPSRENLNVNIYQKFFPKDQNGLAFIKLYYGSDGKGNRNFETIADIMDKPIEEIYELYANTAVRLAELTAAPITTAKKRAVSLTLKEEFEKYWALLTPPQQEVATEYFKNVEQRNTKPLPGNQYRIFTYALERITNAPYQLQAEKDILTAIALNQRYFTEEEINRARLFFGRNPDYTRIDTQHIKTGTTPQNILDKVRALPSLLAEDERLIKIIQENTDIPPFQKRVLLRYFELPDRFNVPQEKIIQTIHNSFEKERYLPINIRQILQDGLKKINYQPQRLIEDATHAIVNQELQQLWEEFNRHQEKFSPAQKKIFALRINQDGSLNTWEDIQEKLRAEGKEITINKIKKDYSYTQQKLKGIIEGKITTNPAHAEIKAELKSLLNKYPYDIPDQQSKIVQLRLNDDGTTNLSWEEIAQEIKRETGKELKPTGIQSYYNRAIAKLRELKRTNKLPTELPIRQPTIYKEVPFDYGKEGEPYGFNFPKRSGFVINPLLPETQPPKPLPPGTRQWVREPRVITTPLPDATALVKPALPQASQLKSGLIKGGIAGGAVGTVLQIPEIYYGYLKAPGNSAEKGLIGLDTMTVLPFTPELVPGGLLSYIIKNKYPSEKLYELGTAITELESCLDSYNNGNDAVCAIPHSLVNAIISGERYTILSLISEKTLKNQLAAYYQSLHGAFNEKGSLFLKEHQRQTNENENNKREVEAAIKTLKRAYETTLTALRAK